MIRFWRAGEREDLSQVLAECLREIESPQEIPACLARHPEQAAELEPLLRTAFSVRQGMVRPVREERRLAARRQFLQAAASQPSAASRYAAGQRPRPQPTPNVLLRPLWSAFAPAAVAAALFVLALVPIMSLTSVTALPGDWNYGFKRSAERVRLSLTLNAGDRLNLELAFHSRRLGEIELLAADHRLNDPTLVQQFADESSALVQSVSKNPQLGPSEALKVAVQTQAQVQALSDRVAPLASASVKPAVDDAVQQSQHVQLRANEVAQAKIDSAAAAAAKSSAANGPKRSSLIPTDSETATPTATATDTATATPTATATATATSTPVAIVPPAQAPPTTLRPPPAPVIRPPSIQATPAPLVPPAQPPASQQLIKAQPLPAGQTTSFTYSGAEMPIPQALASIAGSYDAVFYTQPREHGGQVFEWYPGQSDPAIILEPGSQVAVHVKPGAPATLSYPTAPDAPSR